LTLRHLLVLLAVALGLGLLAAGCGDDDSDDAAEQAEETALTPEQAIDEIALVRSGIEDGLIAYEEGDAATAETLVGDAYLEHFELVEPPLEEADEELNEELEVLIRETLRDAIVEGEPLKDVEKIADEAYTGLDEAVAALGSEGSG
jgi:hypothetical protein